VGQLSDEVKRLVQDNNDLASTLDELRSHVDLGDLEDTREHVALLMEVRPVRCRSRSHAQDTCTRTRTRTRIHTHAHTHTHTHAHTHTHSHTHTHTHTQENKLLLEREKAAASRLRDTTSEVQHVSADVTHSKQKAAKLQAENNRLIHDLVSGTPETATLT
jgi:ABC-type Zn2+ transport system substrate-binding protein/surface adhesin